MVSAMTPSTHGTTPRTGIQRPFGRLLASWALALALLSATVPALPAAAESPGAVTERPTATATLTEQLVFSIGVVSAVSGETVTISFGEGRPETYRIGAETAIQSQNGDPQTVADLEVGNDVIVLSHEGDPTALTIVNGGDTGFYEAGPADVRGHEQDEPCTPCDALATP
jgi:hypothetical protein